MSRILIVDDAKFMRTTLHAILSKDNHEIVGEAENGEVAVSLYEKTKPDLVIMDITMPVMNGIDAIKKIKEIDVNAQIVVCSAMGHQKVVVDAIELGAKDFIVKPFDEHRVLETVERVLSYITS
ncbi:response regulator [Paucisalibacillus sp. EB02]|uniref:response regulator n=1 Tax=Paucisalibacillus sp. EB02 TaxID=1347087 RepID=UPI0004AFA63B|nr:response regulator [Paucisalibacillus sp. EB02]